MPEHEGGHASGGCEAAGFAGGFFAEERVRRGAGGDA